MHSTAFTLDQILFNRFSSIKKNCCDDLHSWCEQDYGQTSFKHPGALQAAADALIIGILWNRRWTQVWSLAHHGANNRMLLSVPLLSRPLMCCLWQPHAKTSKGISGERRRSGGADWTDNSFRRQTRWGDLILSNAVLRTNSRTSFCEIHVSSSPLRYLICNGVQFGYKIWHL